MKYIIVSCLLALAAAAPQYRAPYNPYVNPYSPSAYQGYPYGGIGPYGSPIQQSPHYRNPAYYPGAPAQYPGAPAHILAQYQAPAIAESRNALPDGSYSYSYATADGQQVQVEGSLRLTGPEGPTPAVQGSYSYTSPDGTPVQVEYVADELGFRAHGAHIPNAEAIENQLLKILKAKNTNADPFLTDATQFYKIQN